MFLYECLHVFVCMRMCIYASGCVYMYIYIYVYVYVYLYININIYVYIFINDI